MTILVRLAFIFRIYLVLLVQVVGCFQNPSSLGQRIQRTTPVATRSSELRPAPSSHSSPTQLNMFMGSDGGILGIGGPEFFTILLVGYFVLGPSDLYKLVKEVGKFVQNVRSLGTDLTTTLESNMESTLQLEEIRKAQRELNDAFSFRRSINTDQEEDAFSVAAGSAQKAEAEARQKEAEETTADGPETTTTKRKKIRRRVKRRATPPATETPEVATVPTPVAETDFPPLTTGNVPDLEMPKDTTDHSAATSAATATTAKEDPQNYTAEELATIESEFDQYTSQQRFQQQLSGQWNDKILDAGESLEPMARLMEQMAILEEERLAATRRLEEEYAERQKIEDKFYQRKRELLEQTITETQAEAFGVSSNSATKKAV